MKSSTSKMSWLRKSVAVSVVFAMGSIAAFAQTKTVSGTIVDDFGDPVLGANVVIVGTTTGVTTDMDGNFTLSGVPENAQLKVTFIGYAAQTVPVAGQSKINVTLKEDVEQLEDVVVVGYGTMKKSDLTGSVSSIGTEKLVAKGAPTVMEGLQGSTPGVSITQSSSRAGGGFDIEIRGKSTLGSNNSPLYVVDGVIADDIDWLNPQDIERIDILKDASSTAIYGSRATNGVVIITTKSAKGQGQKDPAPTINYDGYYGVTKAVRMPDFMNASEFAQYRHFRYLNAMTEKGGTTMSGYGAQNYWGITSGNYKTAYLTQAVNGVEDLSQSYVKNMVAAGGVDWKDAILRTAAQQNHYLSVNGNTSNSSYHFGFGYQSNEGVYKGDDMQRFNMKGTVDSKIGKYVNAGISFNAAHSINNTIDNTAVSSAFRLNSVTQMYDEDGNIITYPGKSSYVDGNGVTRYILGTSGDQFTSTMNPLLDLEGSDYQKRTWQVLANLYLEVKPLEDLSIKSTFSPNYIAIRNGQFEASETAARNGADNRASVDNYHKFSWTWDNQINYALKLGQHSINAMGLVSASYFNQEYYNQEAYGVVDQAKWYNLDQASSTTYTSGSQYTEWSMLSYALRLNYTWKNRYMVTGTVRWDASSRFDEDTRWGSFPSAAVAWRLSEEDFIKQYDWIHNLKLRASYGVTGNNYTEGSNYATSVVATGGTYYYGFADKTGNAVYYPSGIVNKKLSWETTKETNIGLDYGFLGGRINGSIDWYTKTSEDLLMKRQLTYEAGGIKVIDNIGKVKNSGIEVSLSTTNIQTKDWTWTTTFNFAHNKNEILEVNGGKEDDIANSFFIGESINALYNYSWDGIVSDKNMTVPNTQIAKDKGFTPGQQVVSRDYYYTCYGWGEGMPIIKDKNGDGVIDSNDKSVVGKYDPQWTGSINTTLTYKNWDFSFSIYTKQNYKVYSAFHNQYVAYGDRGMQHLNMDFYIPAGTLLSCDYDADGNCINEVYQEETHYGKYPFPTKESASNAGAGTIWAGSNAKSGISSMSSMSSANKSGTPSQIVDGSYWKVKNISLGYTFDKKLLQHAMIKNLRLYVNVTNPFVWTKYEGFDPEWCGSSLSEGGVSTTTWQFGGSIKF